MNVIVLVKQVPDTTEMQIDKETGTLIRAGVPTIVNPDDLAAIEEALKMKDTYGAHIHVVTMGPKQAETMMRELIGMGVDDVTLISDRAFAGSDTWATSNTIAEALNSIVFDLILAGRLAIDGDTAQVGPQVAEKLQIPQITYVSKIENVTQESIQVIRDYEDYAELLEAKYPVLLTTLATMNTPRYPKVDYLWDAYDRNINIVTNEDLKLDKKHTGLSGSPTQVKKTFPREITSTTEVLTFSPQEAAEGIAKLLQPYLEKKGAHHE